MSGCSYHVETFLGRSQDVSPKLKEYATSIESGNYQEINFLTMRLQVENLQKSTQIRRLHGVVTHVLHTQFTWNKNEM